MGWFIHNSRKVGPVEGCDSAIFKNMYDPVIKTSKLSYIV
jgi:hypothetical protein